MDLVTQRNQEGSRVPSNIAERGTGVPALPSAPRISRLLALALKLKMEEMIQDGTVKKYSDLARLGQVSAARIEQMMNPLHLAPDIQEHWSRWREYEEQES